MTSIYSMLINISIPIIKKVTSPYSNDGSIRRKTYWISWQITSSFSINIISYFCPSPRNVLINAYMTTSISIPIIVSSSYSNDGSIRRKTYRKSWIIISSFSINIISNLRPGSRNILIDAYMTTTWSILSISITIISCSPDSNNGSIRGKTYWLSWIIISSFSINIISYLCPSPGNVLIDAYITTIIFPIIFVSTNSNNGSIRRKTYWISWSIISSFSINIISNLRPGPRNVLIDAYMTTLNSIPII